MEKEITNIDLIVSKADKYGNITYVNPIFMKISGYEHGELLGKPHSILRHPDMPKVIFKYLWESLHQGNDVVSYVKNLSKDGSYYWVIATVKTAKNPDGTFRNHMSTRRCITESAKAQISALYEKLLEAEKSEGIESSQKLFDTFLEENNLQTAEAFNAYMQNLNK
jgi:PAS domain S-box-containing protein